MKYKDMSNDDVVTSCKERSKILETILLRVAVRSGVQSSNHPAKFYHTFLFPYGVERGDKTKLVRVLSDGIGRQFNRVCWNDTSKELTVITYIDVR